MEAIRPRSSRLLAAAAMIAAVAAVPLLVAMRSHSSGGPPGANGAPPPPAPGPAPEAAGIDIPKLVADVGPAVVNITTTQEVRAPEGMVDPFEFFFGPHGGPGGPGGREREAARRTARGTGFLIDPGGFVVTNDHVVQGADKVVVHLADEREFRADVVGHDARLDVALLKLEGASGLPVVKLGSSTALRVGDPVVAIGNPFGLGNTVTHGIVSAKARSIGAGPYDDFIQTDASINPGNSGGPLFDAKGTVVGINTAMQAGAAGIGFAIPIDDVKDVIPALRDKGHVARGMLGIAVQAVTPDLAKGLGLARPEGALVADVQPGSAGAKAGIASGDVIVSVGGTPIRHADELPRLVARHPPGDELAIAVRHGGKDRNVTAKLDALKDEPDKGERGGTGGDQGSEGVPAPELGVRVSDAPGGGARVEAVLDADKASGLRAGDVIVEIDGAPVSSAGALAAAQEKKKPGQTAVLRVRRGGAMIYVGVPIGGRK
jgi:serine protease Do